MNRRQQQLFETEPAPWELDEQQERLVATVVFAEPPHGPYDYLVPERLRGQVEPGKRLRVPLGKGNRTVTGYCTEVANRPAGTRRLKPVKSVLDDRPLLSPAMLRLTRWLADYYLCSWGQAIEGAVPAGVRGGAGTRQVTYLVLAPGVAGRLDQLKLPAKQAAALKTLADSPRAMTPQELAAAVGCTQAPIQGLRRKELVTAELHRVLQKGQDEPVAERSAPPVLNQYQKLALETILDVLQAGRHQTVLIHGVTGSGKTEVYIRAIEEVIRFGRQAIVLVPEISLTPQTRQRFRERFDRVAVLHSNLTDAERHWHWQRIARGQVPVVVGARSAVFAPTPHLGLIVIDEEHDSSFKQDKVPRYHARRVALERARRAGIPLVLGSATPSLESWYEAQQGNFRLVQMPRRVLDRPLPRVAAIDLRTAAHSRRHECGLSRPLERAIRETLEAGDQVILLLNRRGFSTIIQCPACGFVLRCSACEVALTHHRRGEMAICHYCNYRRRAPEVCPECGFEGLRYAGLGTQRLEAYLREAFPHAPCLRMDSDSMQSTGSHQRALEQFRSGTARILLGTQMISKGHDFPRVTLVGVINADTALHFPDFRAAERTFQLVTQVAGRSGRGDRAGRVIVQTFCPDHPAIQAALRQSFRLFAQQELPARRQFGYPPFADMIRILVRGAVAQRVQQLADTMRRQIAEAIRSRGIQARILGPAPAPLAKLRGRYRFHMVLISGEGQALREAVGEAARRCPSPADTEWVIDVDPVDML